MTEHATPAHSERAHAILSASGADRWLNCPGSVALTKDMPDTTSEYAEWGTMCHELGELALRNRLLGEHIVIPEGRFDAEMFTAVAAYRTYVEELISQYGEEPVIFIEERLDFSRWVPHGFGTGDLVLIFVAAKTVVVVDLKGGQGIRVDAEDNPQLKLYGAGALDLCAGICDIENVRVCIAQPRKEHFDDWTISAPELLAWLERTVAPIAQIAMAGTGKLAAGDHCVFCKAKAQCPERAREAMELFEEHDVIPGLLTFEQIAALLPKLNRIKSWATEIQDFAYAQAKDYGAKIPGYKLVAGRANRKWADEARVAEELQKDGFKDTDIWSKKLIGITAAEQLVGKKHRIFELTIKPEGAPTLVPESDERAEWRSMESVLADFDTE